MTRRELEVLTVLAEGATNIEISRRLGISPRTTERHLTAIYRKLGAANRTQAMVQAATMGLVTIGTQ